MLTKVSHFCYPTLVKAWRSTKATNGQAEEWAGHGMGGPWNGQMAARSVAQPIDSHIVAALLPGPGVVRLK
jgi:hypothetical protein